MKLKLDENLGNRGAELFRQAGHDVATVHEEGLGSCTDPTLVETCRRERRCLVTLDLEFSNPLVFPPGELAGVAVLRLGPRPSAEDLARAMRVLVEGLVRADIAGKLWIVERWRIREYQPEE